MIRWLRKHPRILFLCSNLAVLLVFETTLRVLAAQGLVRILFYPASEDTERFLGDLSPHFGVWHHPNRTIQHRGACFSVSYTTNSYGARDIERSRKSDQSRVVVLGDSFVEGVGVEDAQLFTAVAQKRSGREFLNFGTSGDFSSTQEFLLYRELAAGFDHNEVALFILPANDFSDNEPENFNPKRYRPYLREQESGELEVYYTVDFEDRKTERAMGFWRSLRRRLYNSVYTLNLIRQLGDRKDAAEVGRSRSEGMYHKFSEQDFKRLLWGIERIVELATPRQVTLYLIPIEADFHTAKEPGYTPRLVQQLEQFAKQYPQVRVVDLLPLMESEIQRRSISPAALFLECDGHWSPLGHEVVADILARG